METFATGQVTYTTSDSCRTYCFQYDEETGVVTAVSETPNIKFDALPQDQPTPAALAHDLIQATARAEEARLDARINEILNRPPPSTSVRVGERLRLKVEMGCIPVGTWGTVTDVDGCIFTFSPDDMSPEGDMTCHAAVDGVLSEFDRETIPAPIPDPDADLKRQRDEMLREVFA